MHAGDGNVHTNIPVNSDDYAMLQEANAAVARIMALARRLGGVISGEHGIGITKLEYLTADELAPFAALQGEGRPRGALQRGKLLRGRGPRRRVHAELFADRPREPDPRGVRDRRHRRLDQGLPALRQVQAGVRDARAAREPALLAAQQDPRHVAADRGVPVRGADAPRRVAAPLRRVLRRRRPLHGLPQVREPVPGGHRLRRRLDRDAQPAARSEGKQHVPSGHRGGDVLPQRDRSRRRSSSRKARDDRLGLHARSASPTASRSASGSRRRRRSARRRPSARRRSRRRSSTSSTSRCRAGCPSARRARCSTSRTTRSCRSSAIPRAPPRIPTRCSISPAAARSGCSRRSGSPRRRCSTTSARRRCCRRATCAAAIRRRRRATQDRGQQIITANRVLFHRVANTLNYLDIKTVIVSCGTCMDQLEKYEFDKIFPGCRLLDIHEYLLEKGVQLDGVDGRALHVPRPLPHADEDLRAARGRQRADGRAGGAERALLRRVGHAGDDAAGHLDAGALPQGGGDAQGRGRAARRRLRRRRSRC